VRELAGVLVVAAILLAVSAAAVGPLHDRELFTPPPETVAEGFTRAVVSGRHDQARAFLVDPDWIENDQLRSLERAIESRLGDVHDVTGELISRSDEEAFVTVRMKSAEASEATELSLRWEGGEWKVAVAKTKDTIPANARRRP
jgi:hypothetical protein